MVEAMHLVQKEREEASIARREDMMRADEECAAHNTDMHRRHKEFTKVLLEQAATTIKIQQEQASMEMKMSMQHSHSILHGVAIGKCQGKLELLQINVQLSACAHCMPHGVFQHNNQRFVFCVCV
jgi:Cu/Zn superoxide dismutase